MEPSALTAAAAAVVVVFALVLYSRRHARRQRPRPLEYSADETHPAAVISSRSCRIVLMPVGDLTWAYVVGTPGYNLLPGDVPQARAHMLELYPNAVFAVTDGEGPANAQTAGETLVGAPGFEPGTSTMSR